MPCNQDYAFFVDEAGISNDRFTVVGGICMHKSTAEEVYRTLESYREHFNMKSELKWQKISNQKKEEYTALVDYFFALNNSDHIRFHSVIFDSHQWNHHKYNDGVADAGLSKLYYQLILHKFIKTHAPHGSLYVCLDHRNSKTSLNELRDMLNATALRDMNYRAPVKELVSKDSHTDDLLQLNDVILGAVCAHRKGKHLLADTRPAKRDVAQLVMEKSGLNSFERDSPISVRRFTVWNMRPKPR